MLEIDDLDIGEVPGLRSETSDALSVSDEEFTTVVPGRDAESSTQRAVLEALTFEAGRDQLFEPVVVRIRARAIAARMDLGRPVDLVIALVQAWTRALQRAALAGLGLELVEIVDGEEVGLADFDHGSVRVGLEIVEAIFVARHQTQGDRPVAEERTLGFGLANFRLAVVDRVHDLLGDELDPRHQVGEELVAPALGLDHRELDLDIGVREQRIDEPAQVLDVVARDHAVDREVEAATREVLDRLVGRIEGVATDHQVVNFAVSAVEREVDVAQPSLDQLLDDLGVGEHLAVGHEAKVEPERRGELGPVDQLRPDRRLAAREHDHLVSELGGALDLAVDLGRRSLNVANLEGVAKRAVLVAGVANLDQRLGPAAGPRIGPERPHRRSPLWPRSVHACAV